MVMKIAFITSTASSVAFNLAFLNVGTYLSPGLCEGLESVALACSEDTVSCAFRFCRAIRSDRPFPPSNAHA